ncbi:MAG: cytochrome c biogenesis protein CcsA [Thermoanaerobaculia bacterium]|nr:cytochrome c biogenesis protein CcsA [Thermoanaerobaculia bacterium]
MSYLSSLYLPGAVALWCALGFSLAALWGYARALGGDGTALLFGRRAYRFFALAVTLASAVLLVCLYLRDYRIEYVYQYSGNDLATHFQLAAFWAGQKGSFLVWLFWGALLGLPLVRASGRDEAPVMGTYLLTQLGLLLILVRENPFVMLAQTPADGVGLNPLLQDNWMVIHPPIMFIGYAAAAVPFSFAMAALWRRDYGNWATRAFPWALFGFLVLGTAILMGGYWAYKTLGWGGYWGWDPVENASLIPWIFGTVLIHGLYLERTKGRFRRLNVVLATLVFLSVLYGTFLTRSGVLADFSVHSFVDLGISGWLVALMLFFFLGSAYLMATRLREIPSAPSEDPLLSRGTFVVLGTIALLASAIVVTLGTSAPLLTRFMENPGQVGPEFYNRVNMPIALLVAFLLSLVPLLSWRETAGWGQLLRKARWTLAAGLAGAAVAVPLGVRDPFHLLLVLLAVAALAANLAAAAGLVRRGGLRTAGGYVTHVGVGVILLGFLASSAYDESAKVTLERGRPAQVGDLTLTFHRFVPRTAAAKERMEVEVVRADGRRYLAYPKLFVNDRSQQLMANPHIRSFPLLDLYISPLEYDPGEPGGRVILTRDQVAERGGVAVRFLGFDLDTGAHGAMPAASGPPTAMTVGAVLEITRAGRSERVTPLFRFSPDGRTEFPPVEIPGGGSVALSGIDAESGAVELLLAGLPELPGTPARLSLDVTRKPLIQLVWGGLYLIFLGGTLAGIHRFRQALRHDEVQAAAGG